MKNKHEQATTDSLTQRIQELLELAGAVCGKCGTLDRPIPGIATKAEWERRMIQEFAWARANADAVLTALPLFESSWPKGCRSLREILLNEADS